MKQVWSFSTTVRNPERLRNFLITLKEIEGREWNKQTQIEYQARLIRNRFYGFGNSQFYNRNLSKSDFELIDNVTNEISLNDAMRILISKNYVDVDMRGRNSYKPLEKMGLASIIDKKVVVTSLGNYLLSNDYDLGEMSFKSLLKWQYPNPVDRDFKDKNIYDVKPFILTLHLINKVNIKCVELNIKSKGISKDEFAIFAISLINYKDLDVCVDSLINFRLKLEKINTNKEKNEFIENYKTTYLADYTNIDNANLQDYADNIIRYFRLTRYIYIRGGGFYIDLEPRRAIEIQSLLKAFDGSSDKFNTKKEYTKYISDINLPILPWEEISKLQQIYKKLIDEISTFESELGLDISQYICINSSNQLKNEIEKLRTYRHQLQNKKIKIELQDIAKIDDTIDKLKNIKKQHLKSSIALEKYITMALNIINDAKEIKPNSLVGDDSEFIYTAPANKPDIECYYDSFNSICEVTMLNGRDQWYNEGQPVMRHLRDFENKAFKDTYCIFVAPKIHRDTLNTFWMSIKYEYEGKAQKIIPLTISQIITILEIVKSIKSNGKIFLHTEFQQLLDNIVNLKNIVSKSEEWQNAIPIKIDEFKKANLCK